MSKEIYISSTPHETRLAIVEKDELSEIYYERENEYTLAGSIYNGRVTRVLPGMQSAFVDLGLERDAFLYITDFLEEQDESADFEGGETRRNGERGGGGEPKGERRRGDRDRGGRTRAEQTEAAGEASLRSEPSPDEVHETEVTAEADSNAEDESGEGSRRWRGRRGRRRGRGGEARNGAAPTEAGASAEPGLAAAEPDVDSDAGEPVELRAEESPRESRSGESRSGEERGRERGGRQRDRFADRGRRREPVHEETVDLSASAEPLILPGESLSKYRRGEEGGMAAQDSGTAKPRPPASVLTGRPSTEIDLSKAGWDGGAVLPGESLSRRRGPATEAPVTQRQTVVSAAAIEADSDSAAGSGRDRRRDRDRRRGRGGRSEQPGQAGTTTPEEETPTSFHSGVTSRPALDPMEAVLPGVTSQHEPEASGLPVGETRMEPVGASDDVPSFEVEAFEARQDVESELREEIEYIAETDAAPVESEEPSEGLLAAVQQLHEVVAASSEAHATHAPEEFHEETTEYEPGEDASASYRVQPSGPSEFRQSSLVEDELDRVDVRFDEGSQVAQEGPNHEFTAIQASGEMLSELPGEVSIPGAEENPANPVEHETAVQSVHLGDAEGTPQAVPPAETAHEAQAFAPGAGELEEELLDDEDEGELLDVAASYGDDTEEETLEAGAEIGSMVRDRALEQMTQPETGFIEEDEDDFDIDEEEMEEDELDGFEEIAASDISEEEEDEVSDEEEGDFEETEPVQASGEHEADGERQSEPRRERSQGQTDGRREFRRGGGRDRGGRDRRGMANSRSNGRQGRHSMQNTDLPAISDLLKPGQEVLVQIAKEPIAKKGARITSHIALPGRFLVFMPTVNHVGVSRKIESDGERRRLKEVLLSEKGEAAGGFIVRTAAAGATEEELRSDLRFLLNLWADIKQRSESSKSPALIYHDLNLVERILRDQVTDTFSAIWVDTEDAYERVVRFLQRFQPSLMRRVKLYSKDTPLFEQFGISEEINKALRSKVWLKSGGSIVINQTEALVAIDINTGKYVGKTARLEDTIVKTNLDAIPEIVRQIRLRDLGGIIVIDFIDMDDRKNRQKVLLALEEELKKDRAPSKVLQFNDFGLVAITRKRVKQSLERTLSTTCGICAGTGMVKSPITVCNEIYVELRKMHKQLDKGDIMLRVNPEVVKQLKSGSGKWLQEMEEISGKTILVKSDPSLHPEQFDIH